ncbi:MAG TPA: hypothetical protein VHQ70_05505 [Syntrophomonadaceae bacterium]|nr:hypothetical protein [Syntrophomonadaceae bacterium]
MFRAEIFQVLIDETLMENSSDKSTADNTKLDQLKNQLFQCSQKKDLLKRTVINIYLVEEGTP